MKLKIEKNIPLSRYSTFRIGGMAKKFVEVKNGMELTWAVDYARTEKMPFFVLGKGSNVLFSDRGFDGLIIKIKLEDMEIEDGTNNLEAEAGLTLSNIVDISARNGLTGMEWAAGIPGTLGGAIRGNAGAFEGNMAGVITVVKVFNASTTEIIDLDAKKCDFKYRYSIFKKRPELVILSAKLKLKIGNKDEIGKKIREIYSKRKEKQPQGWIGSAGSFFQNPVVENKDIIDKFEKDNGNRVYGGRVSVGWLIEEAGLKGKKVGRVAVSDKNANFIVNTGGGKAEEVVMLASIIKQRVRDKFGIQLKEEVQLVGF